MKTPPRLPADDEIAPARRPGSRLPGVLHSDPAHWYSEEELDAIEAIDVELALRIDRAQVIAGRDAGTTGGTDDPVNASDVRQAIDEARVLLRQDGGDIDLIGIDDRVVRVRMKGACAGCPNAAADLRNVVERLVRSRSPGVKTVVNEF